MIKQAQTIISLQGMVRKSQQTARELNQNTIQPQQNHFIVAKETDCELLQAAISRVSKQKRIIGKYKQGKFEEFQRLKKYAELRDSAISGETTKDAKNPKNAFLTESKRAKTKPAKVKSANQSETESSCEDEESSAESE